METGLGLTLVFVGLSSVTAATGVITAALGLSVTAGMAHNYRHKRGVERTTRRSVQLALAALAALVVVTVLLPVDLARPDQPWVLPIAGALLAFGLRWLAERRPAPTPWHLAGWAAMALSAAAPLVGPRPVLVACAVCGAALLVMGRVDVRRLNEHLPPA